MKNSTIALLVSLIMLAAGMLFFAYQRNIILFNFRADHPKTEIVSTAQKQSVTFHYFKNNSWQTQQLPYYYMDKRPACIMRSFVYYSFY